MQYNIYHGVNPVCTDLQVKAVSVLIVYGRYSWDREFVRYFWRFAVVQS